MYREFYGLKEKPFEITPDPRFFVFMESHEEALANLIYAVREKKGFTVITGEVGTGKTLLVQTLMSKLDGNIRTAYLFNPSLGVRDFIQYICNDLGLDAQRRSKGECIALLHNFLLDRYSEGESVVLIIDEAQGLEPRLLEEIRLLTNLETPKAKLLQVILTGQPELNKVLDNSSFRQLKQRISLRYHLKSLSKDETSKYIEKRLKRAGSARPNLFTSKAVEEIYRYSKGIPRLINVVCDNALVTGYATDQKIIDHTIVREAIHNLGAGLPSKLRRYGLYLAVLAGCALLGLAVSILWKDVLSDLGLKVSGWVDSIKRMVGEIYR